MCGYDCPEKFRKEFVQLESWAAKRYPVSDYMQLYRNSMLNYFMFCDYEYRKKAVYYAKKVLSE